MRGNGVVFKLDAAGREAILYSFKGGPDGASPLGGLIENPAGTFYGTTGFEGTAAFPFGHGVVFKIQQ